MKEEAVGGFAAGLIGTVIGYPLDTIKTEMQTGGGAKNRSMYQVAKELLAAHPSPSNLNRSPTISWRGIKRLYRGVAPPLISLTALNTINFSAYSYFKEQIFHGADVRNNGGFDIRFALSGLCVAPIASSISTIENLLKTQLQMIPSDNRRVYTGAYDALKSIVATRGISALYTGHTINTLREGAFLATYFGVYEGLKLHSKSFFLETFPSYPQLSPLAVPLSGGIAGASGWFVSLPLDVVKARIMAVDLSHPKSYGCDNMQRVRIESRIIPTIKLVLKERGMVGLYSGLTPSILRAFLVSASRFSAYEGAISMLNAQ
jgi:solute carrier family 25 carnitine/acylcarnitine transporter 20/29